VVARATAAFSYAFGCPWRAIEHALVPWTPNGSKSASAARTGLGRCGYPSARAARSSPLPNRIPQKKVGIRLLFARARIQLVIQQSLLNDPVDP
jgi:hypothetical protein